MILHDFLRVADKNLEIEIEGDRNIRVFSGLLAYYDEWEAFGMVEFYRGYLITRIQPLDIAETGGTIILITITKNLYDY